MRWGRRPASTGGAAGGSLGPSLVGGFSTVVGVRQELVDRYRGRWVAVSEAGEVVADAEEVDVLMRLVERDGPRPDLIVQRVPEVDAPLFIGLG